MQPAYRILGRWLHRRRAVVLVAWLVVLAAAAVAARRAPALLDAGNGALPGTASGRVERALAENFAAPSAHSLAVVFRSAAHDDRDPAFRRAVENLAGAIREIPEIASALLPDDAGGGRFRSADGRGTALLLGLRVESMSAAQRLVPLVRERVASALQRLPLDGWEWSVTGEPALLHDLNRFNAADSKRAELRALPLTLVVLLLVFGSLVSAGLPLVQGLAATILALAIVPLLARFGPVSILYQNVATLLGLALGIDYSLFLVSTYREKLAQLGREDALAETLATTGVAVTYSGLTVLIGLAGLLLSPLFQLHSLGLGGMAVVAASLLLSLTFLPVLLDFLSPWLDAPRRLSEWLRLKGSRQRWERWTDAVLRRPLAALAVGTLALLTLALPLLGIRPGFPDKPWLPSALESSRGQAALAEMGSAQDLTPINLVVRAADGGPVLPAQLDGFFLLSDQLRRHPRVARVYGPVDLGTPLPEVVLRLLYLNFDNTLQARPELGRRLLSRTREEALVQVVLKEGTGYDDSLACARELAALRIPGLAIDVGGNSSYYNDLDAVSLAAYPRVLGFVLAVTFVALAIAFRSWLVPVKALLLNSLSVLAAFGATVAVFQWGWGAGLLGLAEPTGSIPVNIPLIVFCVTFGLSMDYEVFILSRVREEYLRDRDGAGSVRRGLVATGGIITGAAAIMVIVFGAFALADVVLVKMLGFGLAVAVLVDATVVRALMVPAAMKLAGRWNWVPGIR